MFTPPQRPVTNESPAVIMQHYKDDGLLEKFCFLPLKCHNHQVLFKGGLRVLPSDYSGGPNDVPGSLYLRCRRRLCRLRYPCHSPHVRRVAVDRCFLCVCRWPCTRVLCQWRLLCRKVYRRVEGGPASSPNDVSVMLTGSLERLKQRRSGLYLCRVCRSSFFFF